MKPSVLIPFLLLFLASCRREEIDTPIVADFAYEIVDNDYSIPVKIAFANKSNGAQTYTWTFEGGSPENYTQKRSWLYYFHQTGLHKSKAGGKHRCRVQGERDHYCAGLGGENGF